MDPDGAAKAAPFQSRPARGEKEVFPTNKNKIA
jgi:hypothetical protein